MICTFFVIKIYKSIENYFSAWSIISYISNMYSNHLNVIETNTRGHWLERQRSAVPHTLLSLQRADDWLDQQALPSRCPPLEWCVTAAFDRISMLLLMFSGYQRYNNIRAMNNSCKTRTGLRKSFIHNINGKQ